MPVDKDGNAYDVSQFSVADVSVTQVNVLYALGRSEQRFPG